jgi:hypothetical protein
MNANKRTAQATEESLHRIFTVPNCGMTWVKLFCGEKYKTFVP